MRPKSERKFKEEIQDLTCRKRNLDATVIEELNRVIRGTAQYFATHWSTVQSQFRELDAWIRRRVRCMKYKRFSYHRQPPDAPEAVCATWVVEPGELLLEMRNGCSFSQAMPKNVETDSPSGGVHSVHHRELRRRDTASAGVARSGKSARR